MGGSGSDIGPNAYQVEAEQGDPSPTAPAGWVREEALDAHHRKWEEMVHEDVKSPVTGEEELCNSTSTLRRVHCR